MRCIHSFINMACAQVPYRLLAYQHLKQHLLQAINGMLSDTFTFQQVNALAYCYHEGWVLWWTNGEARWVWDLSQIACLDSWIRSCGLWILRQGSSEDWEIRGSDGRRGLVQRWCSKVAGKRKTEFGYFAFEKKAKLSAGEVPGEVVGIAVRRICGVEVCWLFARDVWGCRRLKIQGWSSTVFRKTGWACGIGCGETWSRTSQQQSEYVSIMAATID